MSDAAPHSAPSAAEREQAIARLGEAYAADRIEMDELERRMAGVYRATSHDALRSILADLDGAPAPVPYGASVDALPATWSEYGRAVIAPDHEVPNRGVFLGIFGGTDRQGTWTVPREVRIVVAMGGVTLDMREARFAPGVTEIEAFCLMGGVEILLPDGVRVESMGGGVLGGFSVKGGDPEAGPDAPLLRIGGLAIMGGVDAKRKKRKRRG